MFKSKLLKRIGSGILAAVCAFSFATANYHPVKAKAESVFPTPDQIIAQAATLLGGNYSSNGGKGYYNMYNANLTPVAYDVSYTRSAGVDCSGLVYYTMTKLGYSTSGFAWNHPVPVDTNHWLSYDNPTITYKGTTKPLEIEKIRVSTNNHPYWERSNGSTIEPGSIVIGDPTNGGTDHAWIYMGEFENKAAVKAYLAEIGVNPAYINDKNIHDNGDGGNHWRIEAQSTYGVVINNDTSGKYTGTMRVSAFKLSREATFSILKTEVGTGAIVGKSKVDGSVAVYGVYTDESCTNKINEMTIDANGRAAISLPYGNYYVKELKAPTGYNISSKVYPLVANGTVDVVEVKTTGSIRINKAAEDGVKIREFMISWFENNSIHRERLTTNALGVAKIDGLNLYDYDGDAINYTIAEINNDERNVNPRAQTVTLSDADPDKDYTVNVYFVNKYKYGTIVLHKTHTDGNTDDRTFTVTGNGETYTVVTHGNEPAALENLRIYDDDNNLITYTIHEENVPDTYVQPEDQEVTLLLDQVKDVYIVNSHIPGTLILTKEHEDGYTGDRNFTITGSDGSVRTAVTHGNEPTTITELDVTDDDGNKIVYTIHEENVPDKYVQPADKEFTLELNETKNITFENKLKRGSISIHKQDSETFEPVAGAIYKVTCDEDVSNFTGTVTVPAGETIYTMETDESGNAKTPQTLPISHTYTLTEVFVPDGYVSNEPISIEMTDDGTNLQYETTINEKPTKVLINKKDESGKPVSGATLQVIDPSGKVVDEWLTTENGHEITGVLKAGLKYTLHEKDIPSGYTLAADVQFTVSMDGSLDEVTMTEKSTKVQFSKKSLTGADEVVGAKLTVTDETGKLIDEWISGEKPHIVEALLEVGKTYILHEEVAPSGYIVADDQEFTVNEDGELQIVTMYDDHTKIYITKIDANTGNPLANAVLQILDGDTVVEEWTSTTEVHKIEAKLTAGKSYVLHEVSAPDGYVKADDVEFTVSVDGKIDEINFENKPTIVTISKKSITGDKELPGASLTVTDDNGKIIDEWISTTSEHTIIGKLTVGKEYTLTEVLAPDGFLTAESIKFTVNADGSSTHVTMYDEEKSGSIEVHKTTEGMTNVEGIRFILSGTSDHGTNVNTTATTNADGIATFEKIPVGTYTITEDADTVPYAYLVSDEQSVSVLYAETTIAEVFNDEKSGTIEVHKNTKNKGNIADITFVLEGTSDSGRDISIKAVTDKDGKAIFNNVPVGTYTITEDKDTVPTAYLVADKQEVTVLYAETTIAEVFNDEKTGSIEIHKTTEGMLNIEGIKFILEGVSDSGTDVHIEAVTDKDGKAVFSNVPVGTYSITEDEKTVPAAYMVADKTEVTVLYAETITKEIFNGERSGSISIQKQTEGMKDIEGIKFILEGTSDGGRNIKLEAVTDKDGKATFNGVPIGTYTITEDGKTVPAAYFVADAQTVTVYEAQTSNVTVENKKKPESSTPSTSISTTSNPSTGAATNGAFAVTAIALALMIISKKRKNS